MKIVGFDKAEGTTGNLSPADFLDFQRDATSFARMGANGWVGLATISGGTGEAERVGSVQVTEGFFPTLRRAARARPRHPGRGRSRRALPSGGDLSDGFWRRRFARGSRRSSGKPITINAMPFTVIGVLPASFRHLEINPERSRRHLHAVSVQPARRQTAAVTSSAASRG